MSLSFFSSLFKKDRQKVSAIFNIDGGSVEGALVAFSKGTTPRIAYSVKIPMRSEDRFNSDKGFPAVKSALDKAVNILMTEGVKHLNFTKFGYSRIDNVDFFLSSLWCVSQTKIINIEKNDPFYVTESLINEVTDKEEHLFIDSENVDTSSGIKVGKDAVSMEKKVIQVAMNGYHVSDPYKKKVKNISLYLFLSFVPKKLKELLFSVSNSHFNTQNVNFHSFSFCAFNVVRNLFSDYKGFILLEVGNEASEVSIVKDGVIMETISFPVGASCVAEFMQEDTKSSHDHRSTVRSFSSDHLDEKHKEEVKKTLSKSKSKWLESFRAASSHFSSEFSIPHGIFLLAEAEMLPIFSDFLKNEKFKRFGVLDESFLVNRVDEKLFSGLVRFNEKGSKDLFIATESVFLNSHIH